MDSGKMRRPKNYSGEFNVDGLREVNVYFDERLVPHVFAGQKAMLILYRDICMQNSVYGRWRCRHMLLQAG